VCVNAIKWKLVVFVLKGNVLIANRYIELINCCCDVGSIMAT
jgi:hypothetical protein